jgi:hypothetical protein
MRMRMLKKMARNLNANCKQTHGYLIAASADEQPPILDKHPDLCDFCLSG